MLPALLNIAGGILMFGFLYLMLCHGRWARTGWNRLLAMAPMLAGVASVMWASSLANVGRSARTAGLLAAVAAGLAVVAVLVWWLRPATRTS